MADSSKYEDYELTEEDIDKAIHILSVYDPENATPENAIDFLEYMRSVVHEAAHDTTPEQLQKLYEQFTAQKKDKSERKNV